MAASSGTSMPSSVAKAAIHSRPLVVGGVSLGTAGTYRGAMAALPPNALRVTTGLEIPLEELTWRFSRSGGPGGQHANTADTKVEVRFDIAGSPTLRDHHRTRLLERLGPELRVVAGERRSQARNREVALERLAERLAAALVVEAPRRPTRPTKASVRRRLDAKRRQSDRKSGRRIDPGSY